MTKQNTYTYGKPDILFKTFWRNNDRFADLFNGTIFHGQQVLTSENLHERDTEVSTTIETNKGITGVQRTRDIMKTSDCGGNFLLLGVENQTHIHYGMPLKVLTYDVLGYIKQCEEITIQHKKNKSLKTTDEFLSGLTSTDVLQPIITLVLYYGEEPWNGPLTLKDMLVNLSPEIAPLIADYKMILVQVQDKKTYSFQNQEVDAVFNISKEIFAGNIDKVQKEYKDMVLSSDVIGMIGTITGSKEIVTIAEKKKGTMDMCKALDAYWNKAKDEGHREGHKEGILVSQLNLIRKKLQKNISTRDIAEFMEEDIAYIEHIIQFISLYPDDSNDALAMKIVNPTNEKVV